MSIQDQIKKSLDQHSINTKSVVAYILFGAIILVFVLFGFPGSRGTLGQGVVADVNGELISGAEFKEETSQLERFYGQMFGGNFSLQAQRQLLETQALENLINREILSQEATKAGILVSDREIRDFIIDIPAFQEQGRFDKIRYFQYLEGTHNTAEEFETKIRKEAQRMRVKRIFDSLESDTSLLGMKESQLSAVKLNLQFVKMDRESLVKNVVVSEAQAQEFLKNPDNIKKIEVDYESHRNDLYSSPEQVKAQHILIKVKGGDAEEDKKALARLEELKTRAAKEDFAALAKSFSEDEGSKTKGGDLGYFGRGQMVPPFETAAFGAKVGELVGPVKSTFGYHLIKVSDKKAAKVRTLEEVKLEIARKLIAETQVDERFQKIEEALTKKNVAEIDNQLKSLDVKWDETGDFDLKAESIPKLMGGEALKDAVWTLGQSGQWLDHLVRDGSHRYILKMKEVRIVEIPKSAGPQVAKLGPSSGIFEGWLEGARERIKVTRTQKVMED